MRIGHSSRIPAQRPDMDIILNPDGEPRGVRSDPYGSRERESGCARDCTMIGFIP